ncbi:MAG: Crp/Fnr family transcriptional regulator [Rhizomicrobium sp.]
MLMVRDIRNLADAAAQPLLPSCASCPVRGLIAYRNIIARREFAAESMRTAARTMHKGQVIIHQGDRRQFVYTLRSGWAYRYSATRDGRRQILSLLLPGDLIGQVSFDEQRWGYSVRTLTRATLCEFPRDVLLRELMANPDALADVLRACGDAQRDADEIALSLGARTAVERLAHFILLLQRRVARLGDTLDRPLAFEVPLRRDDLADALGMTAVHVSRSLKKLRDLGIVDFNRGVISIFDDAALRKLAAA